LIIDQFERSHRADATAEVMFNTAPASIEDVRTGKLRKLAVATPRRWSAAGAGLRGERV
jgi:hypothetical protein